MIEHRRQVEDQGNDLLSLLLSVADLPKSDGGLGVMTDRQIRDEIVTMFAVGHETVTTALTWTWYLLATHPEMQAKFHAELDDVLEGRPPGLSDLPKLVSRHRCLKNPCASTLQSGEWAGWPWNPSSWPDTKSRSGPCSASPRLSVTGTLDISTSPWNSGRNAGPPSSRRSCTSSPTIPLEGAPLVHRRGVCMDGSPAHIGYPGPAVADAP